jgi:hypothetical protein
MALGSLLQARQAQKVKGMHTNWMTMTMVMVQVMAARMATRISQWVSGPKKAAQSVPQVQAVKTWIQGASGLAACHRRLARLCHSCGGP